MQKLFKRFFGAGLACLGAVLATAPASAGQIFASGINKETGNAVSAAAEFSVTDNILTLVLTNTTAGGTLLQGDILTGIAFDVAGTDPTLKLTGVTLTDATDLKFMSATRPGTATAPFPFEYSTKLGGDPISEFGVSVTGFATRFKNPTGGSGGKRGIVADGTFPAPPGSGTSNSFRNSFPLYENSLTFTLEITGILTEPQIVNVKFLFGTDGDGVLKGSHVDPMTAVPEPASVVSGSLALALCGLGVAVQRRRRR